MVDSIRQNGRIGVVKRVGQLRVVERRQKKHQQHDHSQEDPPSAQEQPESEQADAVLATARDDGTQAGEETDQRKQTGRRIDVRI